jgi:hypothetical protein
MSTIRVSRLARVGAGLSAALVGATLAVVPAGAQGATTTIPGCYAANLTMVRGSRVLIGNYRYDHFRITNNGAKCRLYGFPTFRFKDSSGYQLGYASAPASVTPNVVVLPSGTTTRITVRTVVPSSVPASQCLARTPATVKITLPSRTYVYSKAFTARVCTTLKYRPISYPVGY